MEATPLIVSLEEDWSGAVMEYWKTKDRGWRIED
jgi:hypothetical protein